MPSFDDLAPGRPGPTWVAPNWYPDPDGLPRLRYWDGGRWTSHYAAKLDERPQNQPTPDLSISSATQTPSQRSADREELLVLPAVVMACGLLVFVVSLFLPWMRETDQASGNTAGHAGPGAFGSVVLLVAIGLPIVAVTARQRSWGRWVVGGSIVLNGIMVIGGIAHAVSIGRSDRDLGLPLNVTLGPGAVVALFAGVLYIAGGALIVLHSLQRKPG